MKKILIGTHNKGKFKEIAYLISKKYKKISPTSLQIKSPKETGKSFVSNSKLKVNYFCKFVKRMITFNFLAVIQVSGGLKQPRETRRIHLNPSWYLYVSGISSHDHFCEKVND